MLSVYAIPPLIVWSTALLAAYQFSPALEECHPEHVSGSAYPSKQMLNRVQHDVISTRLSSHRLGCVSGLAHGISATATEQKCGTRRADAAIDQPSMISTLALGTHTVLPPAI